MTTIPQLTATDWQAFRQMEIPLAKRMIADSDRLNCDEKRFRVFGALGSISIVAGITSSLWLAFLSYSGKLVIPSHFSFLQVTRFASPIALTIVGCLLTNHYLRLHQKVKIHTILVSFAFSHLRDFELKTQEQRQNLETTYNSNLENL